MAKQNFKENKDVDGRKEFVIQQIQIFRANNPAPDLNHLLSKAIDPLSHLKLENKAIQQINIHPVVLSILCGTVFGDSSLKIQSGYSNARLQFRHSTRQMEWFMWKAEYILKEFGAQKYIWFQKPDGFQLETAIQEGEILGKLRYQSKADLKLTAVCNIICPDNKKTIARSWLNHMNSFFLMTLWLDDGSLSKARQGVISCNLFPEKDARILAEYISKVWDVNCKAVIVESKKTKTNPKPMAIEISDFENLEKFIRIIAPIIPVKSMLYKVCLYKQNDPAFLQRWISDLKDMVPADWHSVIDQRYAYLEASDSLSANNDEVKDDV